ncbi:lytic transglycosylase domain-containing protein [Burkholderia multivorans]|uniref:lytic transglycosylase domain-containing protein n=1 Tax=Burkholderia multivorans TaxID=87883 RepID=UPI0021BEFE5D|nr:lytic transglycosylase domain-containing protein [Burkholderia multivorans]
MSASNFDSLFQAAGAHYNVDPLILKAIAAQESSFRPDAVNPVSGAAGLMGFTPATAKAYGINPLDPTQAIPTAAAMFAENMHRFGGNVEQAVAAHFAGPDQKLWGQKTNDYVGNVAAKYSAIKQSGGYAPTPQQVVQSSTPDDVDTLLEQRALGKQIGLQTTTSGQAADPIDDMLAARASGKRFGGPASQRPMGAAPTSSNDLANDLAAGGASSSTLNDLQQIGAGAWQGISSLASNAANVVEKGIAAGANAIPGVRGSAVGNWLTNTANSDVAAQSATDQQFRQTASPGAQAASIVAPMIVPTAGVLKAGNAVRAGITSLPMMRGTVARMVGSGLGNAATGTALAAGTSIDPSQPYWSQVGNNALVGAGVGAATPAAIGAVAGAARSAYNAVRPILDPRGYVGRQLANALGNDAAQAASNIRSAPTFVPGSTPTTAQAGANPVLVATEKAAANANPDFRSALMQRAIDNNNARWQALMNVAGTPADIQAAKAARETAAAPLYQQAHQATANVGPAFMRYAQIPEMQEAMRRANQIASLDAAAGRGIAPVWPQQGGSLAINGAALDYTSRALGDMIGEAQRTGATTRAGSLTALKSNVDNWMARYIPGVQQARAAYAAGSVPVNTMDVGQQIANGLGTRVMNAGGVPEIQLIPYRAALTKAMNSGDAATYGIDANALGTLQRIGQDLQRASISNSIRTPGSDTAYNLAANGWLARQLYGRNFQGGAVGRVLGTATQAAGAAGGAALFGPAGAGVGSALGSGIGSLLNGSRIGSRLNEHLADLLLNPQGFLPYLDAYTAGPVTSSSQMMAQAMARRLRYAPALAVPQLASPQGRQ